MHGLLTTLLLLPLFAAASAPAGPGLKARVLLPHGDPRTIEFGVAGTTAYYQSHQRALNPAGIRKIQEILGTQDLTLAAWPREEQCVTGPVFVIGSGAGERMICHDEAKVRRLQRLHHFIGSFAGAQR